MKRICDFFILVWGSLLALVIVAPVICAIEFWGERRRKREEAANR